MAANASSSSSRKQRYQVVAQDPDTDADADADGTYTDATTTATGTDPDARPAYLDDTDVLLALQRKVRRSYTLGALGVLFGCVGVAIGVVGLLGQGSYVSGGCESRRDFHGDVPQYFQTTPELWAGPTPTGEAAFLASEAMFDPFPDGGFVPNQPLQTTIPFTGMGKNDKSPFQMMAHLSPYKPSPGWGVAEYPLPAGAEIVQVQMLSRHGSRYPTLDANVQGFAERIANATADGTFKASGALAFLNEWKYRLGAEILVPKGRQELFDSGVLHAYMYGRLYNPNSKIIVRTTTQDRMLKSAENWVSGFFGLDWRQNATIEVIIEAEGFNNSLAGYMACPNGEKVHNGRNASVEWRAKYLEDATSRLSKLVEGGYEWTAEDSYAAQGLCPYETVGFGYSPFCNLFTYDEWRNFGYSVDIDFAGSSGFLSPVGRATGLGWQQEFMARLTNHTLGYDGPPSQRNTTLDANPETFPLNQLLYFDFSHDTNIASILTALGLRQFAHPLPASEYPGEHAFTVSNMTPFGARLDVELIRTPRPLLADRSGFETDGAETIYVHMVLNQRTIPLGASFPECDPQRLDGWCELDAFVEVQSHMDELAQFDRACFGDWEEPPYGETTDGAPPPAHKV